MKLEIIAIGDEVLLGQVINTNAAWLSAELWSQGFEVIRHTTVKDDEEEIKAVLLESLPRADVVIVTGGLGPTVDDFTLEVAARTFHQPLVQDLVILDQLKKYYIARNRPMSPNQEKQALIPQGAEVFYNPVGSAPGVRTEYQGTPFFFLPGVPQEMKEIFHQSILPWLVKHRRDSQYYQSKTFRCFGAEEAKLDVLVQPFLKDRVYFGKTRLAFQVAFPEVWIRLSSWGSSHAEAQAQLEKTATLLREKITPYLFSEEGESLEETVGKLLQAKRLTLSVSESCTGGLIANRITDISGASGYFRGGVVAYSNELKQSLLGVNPETLLTHGAVSREVALEMAQGARQRLGSDLAIAVTGIAGPEGGTPEKPVGTVHVALAHPQGCEEKKFFFPFGRETFKKLVSSVALNWIRKYLLP